MNRVLGGSILAVLAQCAFGQVTFSTTMPGGAAPAPPAPTTTTNTQTTFDVATIKPYAPSEIKGPAGQRMVIMMAPRGGPGTNDPTRYQCSGCNLQQLMITAYDAKRWELNIPSFMDNERFDVTAKLPEKATMAQFRLMIQALLAERFKLAIHRENKEMQVYDLVVNKGGPKLKDAAPEEPPPAAVPTLDGVPPPPPPPLMPMIAGGGRGQMQLDKDGFPIMPKMPGGRGGPRMMMMNGRARMQADSSTMEDLARTLSNQMGKPVTDGTGLKGKYEFTLTFDPASMGGGGRGMGMMVGVPGGGGGGVSGGGSPLEAGNSDDPALPTIFGALQAQLGLKLEQKKAPVEIIVVDHVEKTPTEN